MLEPVPWSARRREYTALASPSIPFAVKLRSLKDSWFCLPLARVRLLLKAMQSRGQDADKNRARRVRICTGCIAVVLLGMAGVNLRAQPQGAAGPNSGSQAHASGSSQIKAEAPSNPFAARALADVVRLEDEIATMLQAREELPQDLRAMTDLSVDLRVVRRWMAQGQSTGSAEKFDADLASVIELRRRELDAVILLADAAASTPTAQPQVQAVARLRSATYDLKLPITIDSLDRALGVVGPESAAALGVLIPANPPAMRPRAVRPAQIGRAVSTASQSSPAAPVTLPQVRAQVQQITVSVTLRRQLALLCDAVESARPVEQLPLREALDRSLEIALSLQKNTAVTPEVRQAIDAQLAAAITLFNDPRTRAAGKVRVDALVNYGRLAARIESLPLNAEARQALSPFFKFVRESGRDGESMLGALDTLLAAKLKMSNLPRAVLGPQMRKPIDDARSTCISSIDLAMGDLQQLGGRGAFASTPEAVLQSVTRVAQELALVESFESLDKTLATLNQFKPRTGPAAASNSLERVFTTALVRQADPERAELGQRTIDHANQLAAALEVLSKVDVTVFATPVGTTYANVTSEQFNVAWRSATAQAYTQWVEKEQIDRQTLDRLVGLAKLIE